MVAKKKQQPVKKKAPAKSRYVLVTTSYRCVFLGEMVEDKAPGHVELRNARNVLYWYQPGRGLAGLAEKGPSAQCRIGASMSTIRAYQVTTIADVSEEARKKFEALP